MKFTAFLELIPLFSTKSIRFLRGIISPANMVFALVLCSVVVCYIFREVDIALTSWRAAQSPERQGPRKCKLLPSELDLRHAFIFCILKLNHLVHTIIGILRVCKMYLMPWTTRLPSHEDVIDMIIGTQFVIYVTESNDNESDSVFSLRLSGLALAEVGKHDNELNVKFDVVEKRVLSFEFNGETVESSLDMINIITTVGAFSIHIDSHVLADDLYKQRKQCGPEYDDMFCCGQGMNENAHYYPAVVGGWDIEWTQKALLHNGGISPKHSAQMLRKLAPHSRFVSFLLKARKHVIRLLRKYQIPLDPEHYFTNSLVHSLDHYQYKAITRDFLMPAGFRYNVFRELYAFPVNIRWFRSWYLMDLTHKTPFYKELYECLAEFDIEFANNSTVCMAS